MNLFMVTSPFQYICANEARVAYKTQHNILLLVNQESEPGITQQEKLVKESDWDHIIAIGRTDRSHQVPKAINKIKQIIQSHPLEHFFHAEYTGWKAKLILRNLPIEKEVYFDDGTLTINEYEESIRHKEAFYRPRFIQDLVVRMQGCKPIGHLEQSKNFEIFTVFDIPNPVHTIVKNNLSELQKQYGNPTLFEPSAPIGFIGQGAIGHKRRKTLKAYIKEIKAFKEQFNSDIIYFPHRTESEEVKTAVLKLGGIQYHYSELPLEVELIDKNIKLSRLVGTLSTAQYTALSLYPNMPIYDLSYVPADGKIDYTIEQKTQKREYRIKELFARSGIQDISIKG